MILLGIVAVIRMCGPVPATAEDLDAGKIRSATVRV
jgi:hypothetical protein